MNRRQYLSVSELIRLGQALSQRDKQIVSLTSDLGLVSGGQIRRVCFEREGYRRSDSQLARRTLLRLTRRGVLIRLHRRIGGVKGGSEGFIYRLAPAGQRLAGLWDGGEPARGRRTSEPGERFVNHRLAVSELYVHLHEPAAPRQLELLEFQAEPACWRAYVAPLSGPATLKPDAFAKVGVGEEVLWWFIEVDLGTVGQTTRAKQAAAYRAYYRSIGSETVMPRVLWIAKDAVTAERATVALQLDTEPQGLFVVRTPERAVPAMAGSETSS